MARPRPADDTASVVATVLMGAPARQDRAAPLLLTEAFLIFSVPAQSSATHFVQGPLCLTISIPQLPSTRGAKRFEVRVDNDVRVSEPIQR